jgi:hypothetical protein
MTTTKEKKLGALFTRQLADAHGYFNWVKRGEKMK